MIRFPARIAAALLCLSLASCGAQVVDTPRPVCRLARPGETEAERLREPSNRELLTLVLGEGAETGQRAPAAECSGERVAATRSDCEQALPELPAIPVGDGEIITRRVSDVEQLVWIITRSDGTEGEGPVALVERRDRDLVVRAIGVLRAERGRARLRLSSDGKLLVAESERCENDDDPSTCERTAHLLAREGDRFERASLRHRETNECLAGPGLALTRRVTRDLPDGWQRQFELAASWQEQDGGLVVHETVTMHDSDPRAPSIPARPFRQVSCDRSLSVGPGLRGDSGPLLERALVEFGSVHVPSETQQQVAAGGQ